MLRDEGAVSESVAAELADRVRDQLGADVGVGITGVAGPDPSDGKPPGVMYVAVSTAGHVVVEKMSEDRGREENRREAVRCAIALCLKAARAE